jgi:hypothetical protein
MGTVADADRLYAVPLEDFVEERKRLARELRTAGDRAAAAEVAKLPKPTPPAWALNLLAREEPEAVEAWLDAAETLRRESARPTAGLREAMSSHRDATRALVALARERARPGGRALSAPMLERVRELLQAATVDAAQAEALRGGRVVEGADASGDVAAVTPALGDGANDRIEATATGGRGGTAGRRGAAAAKRAAGEERAERRRAAEARAAEKAAAERAERVAALERNVAEAEAKAERLRDRAAELELAAQAADERLDEARRTLKRTESEAAAAHDAAREAAAATASAERDARRLARQLGSIG